MLKGIIIFVAFVVCFLGIMRLIVWLDDKFSE